MTIVAVPETRQAAAPQSAPTRPPMTRLALPVTTVSRGIGEASQRCLELMVGRYRTTVVVAATSWPFLPSGAHWGELAVSGSMVTTAVLAGRRQSLLRLGKVVRYRSRVRKVVRKWDVSVGANAAMGKVETVHDVIAHPSKSPGHRKVPRLLYGRRSVIRTGFCRWRYVGPQMTPYGIKVTVDGSPTGAVVGAFRDEKGVLRGSWDAHKVNASMNPIREHYTDLSILFDNPFAKTINPSDLPSAREPLGVVLGLDGDGEPLEHSLWLPTLIVGRKGSGKSRLVRRILQGLCEADQPFLVLCFDPKGYSRELDQGQEFPWLKSAVWHYEANPDRWPDFVSRMCTMMLQQASRLGALGWSECPTGDERFPLIVAIVDELGTALDETSTTQRIKVNGSPSTVEKALRRYLRENRSGGATMIANTQVAQKKDLSIGDKSIKDLFDFTVCLGVNNAETTRMALGVSDAGAYPAHELPADRKHSGRGFAASSDRGIREFRAAFTDDAATQDVTKGIAAWTEFYRARER